MSRSPFDLIAPFTGQHNPLRFGWSAEQLEVIRKALGLNGSGASSIAAIVCSLVAEKSTTGRPLRYSRSQSNYSFHDAYEGDELMTYRRVIPAADWLVTNGYAEGHMGVWAFKKQSVLSATPKLMTLAHLVDINKRQGAMLKDEIVLRDTEGKSIGFCETDEIRRMRAEMRTINAHLANQQYFVDGAQLYIPPAARIFNQTLRRGGRLYHQGSSYQQMPEKDRRTIQMLVDGKMAETTELDFESLHMRLVYHLAGKTAPGGDLYEVEGFTRELAKVATLIFLNANGNEVVGAITSVLADDDDLRLENGLYDLTPTGLRAAVQKLIAAIKSKHYRVQEYFGTGIGAELMRADSDIAVKVMLALIEITGRCPLVAHDSFIVPKGDDLLLEAIMGQALASAQAWSSTPPSTPEDFPSLPYIHLGKRGFYQEECILPVPLAEKAYALTEAQRHDPGLDPPPRHPERTSWTRDLTVTATPAR